MPSWNNISALKKALYLVHFYLFYVLDGIACASKKRSRGGVAIVRLDSIGDFVLWLDSVDALLKRYKGRSITLIANSTWSELAEKLPFWDNIIPVDAVRFLKNPIYRFSVLRGISRMGFEIAVHPVYSRFALIGDTIIRSTQAKERIGSVGDYDNIRPWQKRISDGWYTELLTADRRPMMELQRNEEFVRAIGNADFRAGLPLLPKVSELSNSLRIEHSYFIIFPGASWSGRKWSKKSFAELIDKIGAHTGWTAVLSGSHAEYQLCADVAALATRSTVNLAGKASLSELVEIIRKAEILVGNETSAVHISSAVGTPSICILGGGHFGRFVPYKCEMEQPGVPPLPAFHTMECFGCNWHCTQRHESGQAVPCIARVEVAQVFEQIKGLLESHKDMKSIGAKTVNT